MNKDTRHTKRLKGQVFLLPAIIQECTSCTRRLTSSTFFYTFRKSKYCRECKRAHITFCHHCGEEVLKSECKMFNTSLFCEPCLTTLTAICQDCNVRYLKNRIFNLMRVEKNKTINKKVCEECRWDNYIDCASCNGITGKKEGRFCSAHNRVYCTKCAHPQNCDIYTYDELTREKGFTFLQGEKSKIIDNQIFMGIEIEAEKTPRYKNFKLPRNFITAYDGSLRNGMEICTPPASGIKHYENIKIACQAFKDANFRIEPTCGLHVHLDMRTHKFDFKYLAHLFIAFFAVEDILFAMQPNSRLDNKYCMWLRDGYNFFDFYGKEYVKDFDYRYYKASKEQLTRERLNKNIKNKKYTIENTRADSHHYGVNLHSIFYRGSLEIRMHSGTLNPLKIVKWCDLLQKIIVWIDSGYNYKIAIRLLQLPASEEKIALMQKTFKLSNSITNYIRSRIIQFHHMGLEHKYVLGISPRKYKTVNVPYNDAYARRIII